MPEPLKGPTNWPPHHPRGGGTLYGATPDIEITGGGGPRISYKDALATLATAEAKFGRKHLSLVALLLGLAGHCRFERKYRQATKFLNRALSIQNGALDPHDHRVSVTLYEIGCTFNVRRKYRKAALYYERALSIHERHPQDISSFDRRRLLLALASAYPKLCRFVEARSMLSRAADIETPFQVGVLKDLRLLADLELARGRYDLAEKIYIDFIEQREAAVGSPNDTIVLWAKREFIEFRSRRPNIVTTAIRRWRAKGR